MFEIELFICIKMDLVLDNLWRLIFYKNKPTNLLFILVGSWFSEMIIGAGWLCELYAKNCLNKNYWLKWNIRILSSTVFRLKFVFTELFRYRKGFPSFFLLLHKMLNQSLRTQSAVGGGLMV